MSLTESGGSAGMKKRLKARDKKSQQMQFRKSNYIINILEETD